MPFLGVWGGEHLRAGGPLGPCANGALSLPAPVPIPTPAWSAGIIEGFKEEKAGLQEALGQKEASERGLVGELEGLRQQLQRAARRQAELREENAALCSQTEALAADAREKEAGEEAGTARSRGLFVLRKGGGAALEGRAANRLWGQVTWPGGRPPVCDRASTSSERKVLIWDQRIEVWSTQIRVLRGNSDRRGFKGEEGSLPAEPVQWGWGQEPVWAEP